LHPKVLIFSCNWDGWSCVEAAASSGLHYPSSVKVVRVSCLSRIHAGLILKAFEFGAEGVMLLGCEPGNCQFASDSERISKEYEKTQNIMEMLGIWKCRLKLVQLPAFEGHKFITQVNGFLAEIERAPVSRRVKTAGSSPASDMEVTSYR